jgi:hypothetical protein
MAHGFIFQKYNLLSTRGGRRKATAFWQQVPSAIKLRRSYSAQRWNLTIAKGYSACGAASNGRGCGAGE